MVAHEAGHQGIVGGGGGGGRGDVGAMTGVERHGQFGACSAQHALSGAHVLVGILLTWFVAVETGVRETCTDFKWLAYWLLCRVENKRTNNHTNKEKKQTKTSQV